MTQYFEESAVLFTYTGTNLFYLYVTTTKAAQRGIPLYQKICPFQCF